MFARRHVLDILRLTFRRFSLY